MLHSKIFAKSIRKIDTVLIPLKFQKFVFPEIVFISVLSLKIFFLTLSETVNPISHEVGVNLTPILLLSKNVHHINLTHYLVFFLIIKTLSTFYLGSIFSQILGNQAHGSGDITDRGGSRTAATSKMERFVIIVNGYYHKVLHLGCCSSPRSTSHWCFQ